MRVRKIIAATAVAILLASCTNAHATVYDTAFIALPTPAAVVTPMPVLLPTLIATPAPDPYFTEGEQVTSDEENGYWLYSSPTLWVEINRIFDKENIITYFTAEVRVKPGETERGGGFPHLKSRRQICRSIRSRSIIRLNQVRCETIRNHKDC
jgi:hypothetical protein